MIASARAVEIGRAFRRHGQKNAHQEIVVRATIIARQVGNARTLPRNYAHGHDKEFPQPAPMRVASRSRRKQSSARYVAAGPGTRLEGNLPHGPVVILRWDSLEALEGWRNSREFQAALNVGEKYAKFNIVAVNGLK